MPNSFLFEKFYLHYALCDFDSIFLHYAKLFIRQSIDREKIFDVTFQNPPPLKNPAYATENVNFGASVWFLIDFPFFFNQIGHYWMP